MSKKKQIRLLLQDYQPHSPEELVKITHRFSAVISSLRSEGDEIETIRISHNKYVYRMRQKGICRS
jgi:biotin operon repressor